MVQTSTAVADVRVEDDIVRSGAARAWLAVLRVATGFVFLWAFLDKTFGLGFSTSSDQAWIHGGAPSQGFLKSLQTGPLVDFFHTIASPVTDWLFQLGMLGVGVAVMLGAGVRIAAWAGTLIMAMMWFAEWPLASGSTNPVVDYHVVYALALIVGSVLLWGDTWGLGRWWGSLEAVQKNPWLR